MFSPHLLSRAVCGISLACLALLFVQEIYHWPFSKTHVISAEKITTHGTNGSASLKIPWLLERHNVKILEDGSSIGKRLKRVDEVKEVGFGGFKPKDSRIYFSSSDGSDPSKNGKSYSVWVESIVSTSLLKWLIPPLLFAFGVSCFFIFRNWQFVWSPFSRLLAPNPVEISKNENDESIKIDMIRIILGFVLVLRYWRIAFSAGDIFEITGTPEKELACWAMLVFCLCFFLGIATPISGLAFFFSARVFDLYVKSTTLGTTVAMLVVLALVLSGAGRRISVDHWILSKWKSGFFRGIVSLPYRLVGVPSTRQLKAVYLLSFGLFAAVSFGAAQYHFFDHLWVDGKTMEIGFQNAFLCRWAPFFRWVEVVRPEVLSYISLATTVFQSVWEFLMFPLIFFRHTRWFTITFGIAFFFMSEFALILSTLPRSETCLWLLVFAPASWFVKAHRALSQFGIANAAGSPLKFPRKQWLNRSVVGVWVVLITFYISTMPWFSPYFHGSIRGGVVAEVPITKIGLWTPNVYTDKVMRTADRWAVIDRIDSETGERSRMPLNNDFGARLAYHSNDLLCYGHTVVLRKFSVGAELDYFTEGKGNEILRKLCAYDAKVQNVSHGTVYEVVIREIDGTNTELPPEERFNAKIVLKFVIEPDETGSYLKKQ